MAFNPMYQNHLVNGASLAATYTSPIQVLHMQDNLGIQLNWTGTPTGTFAFQVSADYAQTQEGTVQNPGHWVTLTVTPTISAAGSADQAYVDLNQLSSQWVRIVYTRTSGSGTLDVWTTAKGV